MVRLATTNDLPAILEIKKHASAFLKENGVDQWQYEYPNEDTFINDIHLNQLYVYENEQKVVGIAAISPIPEPTYEKVFGGDWSNTNPYYVVHRLAVHKDYHSHGVAKQLMLYAQELATLHDIYTIRIDTHYLNLSMQNLLKKLEYNYIGEIHLDILDGDPLRIAFEKIW